MSSCRNWRAMVGAGLLVLAGGPAWAALRAASAAEVRAEAERLQGVVSVCVQQGGAACDAKQVGDDVQVGDPKQGGYTVHWDWLRDALNKSRSLDAGKRKDLLRDSSARLSRMEGEIGDGARNREELARARSVADAVLEMPEFQRKDTTTWWDRVTSAFYGWLAKMVGGIARVGAHAPWLGTAVIWTLCVGSAAGLLFFVLRSYQRARLQISLAGAAAARTAWDREATDWARQADEFAREREWREAVHCLYWAAIVSLESRRAWRHNPTRTPREYVQLLKPGSAQREGLRGLTQMLERVWYGLREGRAEEYAEARGLYESLASGSGERLGRHGDSAAVGGEGGAA